MDLSSVNVISWSLAHVLTFGSEITYILGSCRLLVGELARAFFVTECMVCHIYTAARRELHLIEQLKATAEG